MSIFGPRNDSTNDPYAWIFKDQKNKGVNGGNYTSGAWQTRDLNTSCGNMDSSVALANNKIKLQPGTYHLRGSAPALRVTAHQARVWNVTRKKTEFTGTSEFAGDNFIQSRSMFECNIAVAEPGVEEIEIQHRCQLSRGLNGCGAAGEFGYEVYTIVTIWKVA